MALFERFCAFTSENRTISRDKWQNLQLHHNFVSTLPRKTNKKLITRWDSERELFYDDTVHALQI